MSTLIIGSTAAHHWFTDWRKPKDLDVWSDETVEESWAPGHKVDNFWDDRLATLIDSPSARYATPDELYTIKHSHAYWELKNGSWSKHMWDLLELQRRGAQLIPAWHDRLYEVWSDIHGRKMVDLTQEADEFFTDAVKRKYVHDSIHETVAYYDKPLYDYVLKDGKSVQMDMKKVWALPHDDIVKMFREEVYVTSLERLLIPNDYHYSPGRAYLWALRRTITSLTKGKSARFLVSNYRQMASPDIDYVKKHLDNKEKLVLL
jgi:hypothetical protein